MDTEERKRQSETVVLARISRLRELAYEQVALLPEAATEDVLVAGKKCSLGTYVDHMDGDLLVTVHLSCPAFWGLVGWHTERGVVFAQDGSIREATSTELLMSGG